MLISSRNQFQIVRAVSLALLLCAGRGRDAEAACVGASPTFTAASAADTDIKECLVVAKTGDTVNVPAGSATWNTGISITSNISLIAAGKDKTQITVNAATAVNWSVANNSSVARLSGFGFDLGGTHCALDAQGSTTTIANKLDRMRVDNNRFTNSTCTSPGGTLNFTNVWGVVDHNEISNVRVAWRTWGTGTGANNWTNWGELNLGTDQTLWFEDNTITLNSAPYMAADCDLGGRYSVRYNSFNATSTPFPWLDWHGWTSSGNQGCFGGEIYGNSFSSNAGPIISQRGGRAMVFNNSAANGAPSYNLYDNNECPADARQKINNSYGWNNRQGMTGSITGHASSGGDMCSAVVANVTFWLDGDNPSGNGVSVGVGMGPLTNRSATCTEGVGYWATDQSITNLSGTVGPNPTTPIRGTLYRCSSAKTWVSFYTPLTYPHPLVAGTSVTGRPPLQPQNLRVL